MPRTAMIVKGERREGVQDYCEAHRTGEDRIAGMHCIGGAVGKLTYDSTLTVDFDDRVLAHLQLVIGAKLRRGESFYFSWRDDPGVGDGRSALWIHPTIPLYFKYAGGRQPSINRGWIDLLMSSANSPSGLHLMPEPEDPGPVGEREQ